MKEKIKSSGNRLISKSVLEFDSPDSTLFSLQVILL